MPGLWLKQYVDICRRCKGTGSKLPLMPPVDGAERVEVKCDLCHGSGKVDVEKEIKIIVKPHKTVEI